jgi:hypothetical protein
MTLNSETTTIILWVAGLMFAQFTALRRSIQKVADEIVNLKVNAKDFVTHPVCSTNRKDCPCVREFGNLKEKVTRLEAQLGE